MYKCIPCKKEMVLESGTAKIEGTDELKPISMVYGCSTCGTSFEYTIPEGTSGVDIKVIKVENDVPVYEDGTGPTTLKPSNNMTETAMVKKAIIGGYGLYEWVKKLGQQHLAWSSDTTTLCGMSMLGNNYAKALDDKDKKLCKDCKEHLAKIL